MKKVIVVSVLSLISLLVAPVHAATATGNFDVNINLTSACLYAKTSDVQFDYVSFQATAQSQTTAGGFTVRCTNTLPYTMALDGAGSYTDAALNLAYTLSLSAAGATGNGTLQTFSVSGSMGLGQSGNCLTPGGSCTNIGSMNKTRTLTITY